VGRNVGKDLFVSEVAKDRCAVFFGKQGGPANGKAPGAVQTRARDGMTNGARNAFVIEWRERCLLSWLIFSERAGKQCDWCVTTLAVPREFNAACAQQNVGAFTIERFARGVSVQ